MVNNCTWEIKHFIASIANHMIAIHILILGFAWWHHDMEMLLALLALCEEKTLVIGLFSPTKGQEQGLSVVKWVYNFLY